MANVGGLISAPISINADIAKVLGSSSYDLGTLCKSSAINMWSRKKPIQVNQYQELTDAQWKQYNYGYTIPTYTNLPAVWNAYIGGTGWTYTKPTSYFRATDFEGYSHNASSPFDVELLDTTPAIGGSVRFSMEDISDILTWGYFSEFAPTYTGIQLGIMCLTDNGYGYYPMTGPDGLTLLDIEWSKINCSLPSSQFTAGKSYRFCPVLTTWKGNGVSRTWHILTSSDTSGTWWLLPAANLTATIQENTTIIDKLSFDVVTNSMTFNSTDFTYNNINLTLTMRLDSTYTGTAPSSVSATIYCPDHYPGTGTATQRKDIGSMCTTSLSAGGSYSKTISNSDTFARLTAKDEGTMNCYIDVTAIVSGTTYTGRFAVALEATTIV